MKLRIEINPTNAFSHLSESEVYGNCGIVPMWLVNPNYIAKPAQVCLEEQYRFGTYPLDSSLYEIKADGTFQYPQDPPQSPLVKITRGDEVIYQYASSFVAIVQKDGSSLMQRMD